MESFRKKLFDILETDGATRLSKLYDIFMLVIIVISIFPLAFRYSCPAFEVMDKVAVTIFIIDYLMRWMTADLKSPTISGGRPSSFILSPPLPSSTCFRYCRHSAFSTTRSNCSDLHGC